MLPSVIASSASGTWAANRPVVVVVLDIINN
jgi:hypothetical protein